ncbi:hypothetical protein Pla8534_35240 [Lignipirellula cremea]|uniref:Uncharacterized protein n=1 Tax=Lignipirellula cremea TaxID=2528010 RepID=A0A518DV56_9BACT|nr:hypothetical protein Pla8534_35240 [Lignipirellula cremea]
MKLAEPGRELKWYPKTGGISGKRCHPTFSSSPSQSFFFGASNFQRARDDLFSPAPSMSWPSRGWPPASFSKLPPNRRAMIALTLTRPRSATRKKRSAKPPRPSARRSPIRRRPGLTTRPTISWHSTMRPSWPRRWRRSPPSPSWTGPSGPTRIRGAAQILAGPFLTVDVLHPHKLVRLELPTGGLQGVVDHGQPGNDQETKKAAGDQRSG